MNKQRIIYLKEKVKTTIKEEGIKPLFIKTCRFTYRFIVRKLRKEQNGPIYEFKDILFINGCGLPHPQRYRVDHQIEQLEAHGISCSRVNYEDLNLNFVKYFRGFVIYRCPIIPVVEEFIKKAKENNKVVFYDIDDLVFDLEYTSQIRYLDNLSQPEIDLYNDGVKRMGDTLKLCDYGIATTKRLQIEMGKHLKEVFINRNVASNAMVMFSKNAIKKVKKDESKIIIGYLSGSITHNEDFKLIMPAIIEIMNKYKNVYLQIVGFLDLPLEMQDFKDRVITAPFMPWAKLPELISSLDINLAPLEDTVFNEAKSENKWTEAGLCKVPTVASNVGAFKEMIEDGVDGILCSSTEEWISKLSKIIEDKEFRIKIGENAYEKVINNSTTLTRGKGLADFIMNKLNKNIAFLVPSIEVSGGIMVAIKHAHILKKNGYDVTIFNSGKCDTNIIDECGEMNVISAPNRVITARIDQFVATMWPTVPFVRMYANCENKKYLVQNFETQFYTDGNYEKIMANATYNYSTNIKYITISKWCQRWLKERYNKESLYAPNGIDIELFKYENKRTFKGKIKILIEGNCKDYYKNVDESFNITNELDKNKYEIHYLSYEKEPKEWYQYDYFYNKIPHDEVCKIYSKCDILLKTSILESFSYPPLEMMATGGVCVVVPNEGNVEYLEDEKNCLFYEQGNIEDAISKIEKIVKDKKLRDKIIEEGLKTVKSRDWNNIEQYVLNLYKD